MAALGSIWEDTGEEEVYDERQYSSEDGRVGQTRSDRNGERRVRTAEEKEKEGFSDHERWSEEAEEQQQRVGVVEAESERRAEGARNVREGKGKGRAKRAVAVVVSADTDAEVGGEGEGEEDGVRVEHAVSFFHPPASASISDSICD